MAKSSSEILKELFHTFNTTFDESEAALESLPLTSKSKKKKKHSKEEKSKKSKEPRSTASDSSTPSPKKKKRSEKKSKLDEAIAFKESAEPSFKSARIILNIEEGEIFEDTDDISPRDNSPRQLERNFRRVDRESSEDKFARRNQGHNLIYRTSSKSQRSKKSDDYGSRRREKHQDSRRRSSSIDRSERCHRENSRHLETRHQTRSPKRSHSRTGREARVRRNVSRTSGHTTDNTSGKLSRDPDLVDRHYTKHGGVDKTFYFNDIRNRNDRSVERVYRRRTRSRDSNYSGEREGRRRNSYSNDRRRRSRSRSYSRSRRRRHPEDIIDKAKLLEIARRNAAKLMKTGCLPTDIFSRDQIVAIRAGGKSVDELTSYCQRLARREALGMDDLSSDDSGNEGHSFIHHPFVVKDRPMPSITMNIRNAIPLPVRSAQELAIENAKLKVQFPVSSGTQHRLELEWKPVEKDEENKDTTDSTNKSLVPLEGGVPVGTVAPMPQICPPPETIPLPDSCESLPIMPASAIPKLNSRIKLDPPPTPNLDIGTIISIRLRAMRKLQENPEDAEAKQQLEEATNEMKTWAEVKSLEPKFLSAAQITGGPQAWAKKDQLKTATAVSGGMGMHLLQRMGWKPGEGLGKNKEGGIEPLALDVKMDKKGLTATTEVKGKEKGPNLSMIYDLSGKHPVSALMELCVKRRWGPPNFELCFEHGPPHKKQFVYKVVVNGIEYQPCVATNNKKQAKCNSAAFCLQSLGLLSTAPAPPAVEVLRTVPESQPPVPESLMPPPPPPPPPTSRTSTLNIPAAKRFIASHTLQTVPTGSPSVPSLK